MVGTTKAKESANSSIEMSLIIVSYNSPTVQETLSSIFRNPPSVPFEVIVVENNHAANAVSDIIHNFPSVQVIVNRRNRGFAQGNNIGIAHAQGATLVFFNPDIILKKNTLNSLFKKISADKTIGVIAPKLINSNGTLQYSCRRLPTLSAVISRFVGIPSHSLKRYEMRDYDHTKERDVDWCSGAFLMTRKEVLDKVGIWDEHFFMYLEDTDLCRRVNHQYRVVYYPHARAQHRGSYGSRKRLWLAWYHFKSVLYYFSKWGVSHA